MLELAEIDRVAGQAAAEGLGGVRPTRVVSAWTTDLDGRSAMRVTIVVASADAGAISPDDAFDTVIKVKRAIQKNGDERMALVSFATEEDLAQDPESDDPP